MLCRALKHLQHGYKPVIVSCLAGLTCAISGCAGNITNFVGKGTLVVAPTAVAFGKVLVGHLASMQVSLVNQTAAAVQISQVNVTGQSFSVGAQASFPIVIAAGGTYSLPVEFDPSVAGAASGQLTISSDSLAVGTAMVALSGTGTQATATVSAISCISGSMTGAGADPCSVALSAAAPAGGLSVALSSSNAGVTVPATVTVPEGATSAAFTITAAAVTATQAVTVTASGGGTSQSVTLELNAALPLLNINSNSLAFGLVTVSTSATQSLTLASAGTAPVTISAVGVQGSGFLTLGANLPLILSPGQTATLNVEFSPAVAGAVTGRLTIVSDSSSGTSATISLSGTGEAAAAKYVDLNWNPPVNSADPIAGYHIYRATSGAQAYQLLNSSVDTQTTYADNAVQAGVSYDYYVESVDYAGVESGPSNAISVTIP